MLDIRVGWVGGVVWMDRRAFCIKHNFSLGSGAPWRRPGGNLALSDPTYHAEILAFVLSSSAT